MKIDAKWLRKATLSQVKGFKLSDLQGAYAVMLKHQGAESHRLTSHTDFIRERDAVESSSLKEWMEAQGIDPGKGRAFLRKADIDREFTITALNALREKFL